MPTQSTNLFDPLSAADSDANVFLQAKKSVLNRAAKVIEHWRDMATDPRYSKGGQFRGECLNPLASREHDNLWEQGDGDQIVAIVRHQVRNSPAIARLATNSLVKDYVNPGILDIANTIIAQEDAKTFHKEIAEKIAEISARRDFGGGIENNVREANAFVSDQKIHGHLNESEMQNFYKLIQVAAYQPTAHIHQLQAYESAIATLRAGEMPSIKLEPYNGKTVRFNDIIYNNQILAMWDDDTVTVAELLPILEKYQATYLERFNALDLASATPGATIRAPIIGKVIDASADYIVQDIGKGKRIWHAYNDLDLSQVPDRGIGNMLCIGDRLEIKYTDNGKAKVTNLDQKSLEKLDNAHSL